LEKGASGLRGPAFFRHNSFVPGGKRRDFCRLYGTSKV
jgi:hypothetical protein